MKKAERPKGEKGVAVCLEVRIRSSTSVHVNSEPLAAFSGMTAVALPWVSQRILHQHFPFGFLGLYPWTMTAGYEVNKPKRKKEWSHPVRQDKAVLRRPRA